MTVYAYLMRLENTFRSREDLVLNTIRYDNAPHYPHLSTFPSHKHTEDSVVEAEPPDLSDVLRVIDAMIYPEPEGE